MCCEKLIPIHKLSQPYFSNQNFVLKAEKLSQRSFPSFFRKFFREKFLKKLQLPQTRSKATADATTLGPLDEKLEGTIISLLDKGKLHG